MSDIATAESRWSTKTTNAARTGLRSAGIQRAGAAGWMAGVCSFITGAPVTPMEAGARCPGLTARAQMWLSESMRGETAYARGISQAAATRKWSQNYMAKMGAVGVAPMVPAYAYPRF